MANKTEKTSKKPIVHDAGIRTVSVVRNTWILEVPEEVCKVEGFAKGTLVCLTFKDNAIQARYIKPPSDKFQKTSRRVLERNFAAYEEMRKIDD